MADKVLQRYPIDEVKAFKVILLGHTRARARDLEKQLNELKRLVSALVNLITSLEAMADE
jgi:hypothetical protein